MSKYRFFLFCFLIFFCGLSLFIITIPVIAAPAAPVEIEIVQPDGTTFIARSWGDEWQNGFETIDGYTVLKDDDGWWVYGFLDKDGLLKETRGDGQNRLLVGISDPENLPIHIRPKEKLILDKSQDFDQIYENNSGNQPILVLLASFSNRSETYTASTFQNKIFGSSNSVKDYYMRASFNQLNLIPALESHGSVNDGVIGWLNLGYSHPDTGGNTNTNTALIVKNALIAADPYINYAVFDTNNDGYISRNELHIIVVVAGYEAAYGGPTFPSVWAHHWSLDAIVAPTLDGKVLGSLPKGGYSMFGEIHDDHPATIGVIVHELGHDLNWPDLYDVDGSSAGIGEWSIMASGSWNQSSGYFGSLPALPDAWLKWYQGWISPIAVNGTISVNIPKADSNPTVYLLRTNPGGVDWIFQEKSGVGEYFLVENRQLSGYDAGLPGSGLLVWHIDEAVSYNNNANANETRPLVKLMQADGLNDLENFVNNGDDGDPFPGSSGQTIFNFDTNPSSKLYSGSNSGVAINSIGNSAPNMEVTMAYSTGGVIKEYQFLPMVVKSEILAPPGIRNGTFELGRDGSWIESSSNGYMLIWPGSDQTITPYSGNWFAWLGGDNNEESRLIQNDINMGTNRYLRYMYRIGSNDICGYDFSTVLINGSVKKTYNLCASTATGMWMYDVLDLNPYLGTKISLEFKTKTDSSYVSNFFLDDVSISNTSTMSTSTSESLLNDWNDLARKPY